MNVNREIIETLNEDISQGIMVDIPLSKKGHNYIGLCPFHAERTPSFNVSDRKGIFKCFGCGESGDLIAFKMKYHNTSFMRAVNIIAAEKGIDITSDDVVEFDTKEAEILTANGYVSKRSLHQLTQYDRDYLMGRGLSEQTIEFFEIGRYDSRDVSTEDLYQCGLMSENGYELLKNRIIFPIKNKYGRVIAFGGRTTDPSFKEKKIPKYINTSATIVYDKGRTLFNFWNAAAHIQSKKVAIVVEGYMDVIGLWDKKVFNSVGVCGTSFTELQAKEISRYTDSIVFMYDNDAAGLKALERSIKVCLKIGINPSFVILKTDPDEVVNKIGGEAFDQIVANASTYISVFIKKYEKASVGDKERMVADMKASLNGCLNPIFKINTIRILCESLMLKASIFDPSLGHFSFSMPHLNIPIEINFENKFLSYMAEYKKLTIDGVSVAIMAAKEMEVMDCFSVDFNETIAKISVGDLSMLDLYDVEDSDLTGDEAYEHLKKIHRRQVLKCLILQNKENIKRAESDEELELYLLTDTKLNKLNE